jgi:hypothetical protein
VWLPFRNGVHLTEFSSEQWQEVEARARPMHHWLALDPPLLHLWPLLDAAVYARAVRGALRGANVIACGNVAALPPRRLIGKEHAVPFR